MGNRSSMRWASASVAVLLCAALASDVAIATSSVDITPAEMTVGSDSPEVAAKTGNVADEYVSQPEILPVSMSGGFSLAFEHFRGLVEKRSATRMSCSHDSPTICHAAFQMPRKEFVNLVQRDRLNKAIDPMNMPPVAAKTSVVDCTDDLDMSGDFTCEESDGICTGTLSMSVAQDTTRGKCEEEKEQSLEKLYGVEKLSVLA